MLYLVDVKILYIVIVVVEKIMILFHLLCHSYQTRSQEGTEAEVVRDGQSVVVHAAHVLESGEPL